MPAPTFAAEALCWQPASPQAEVPAGELYLSVDQCECLPTKLAAAVQVPLPEGLRRMRTEVCLRCPVPMWWRLMAETNPAWALADATFHLGWSPVPTAGTPAGQVRLIRPSIVSTGAYGLGCRNLSVAQERTLRQYWEDAPDADPQRLDAVRTFGLRQVGPGGRTAAFEFQAAPTDQEPRRLRLWSPPMPDQFQVISGAGAVELRWAGMPRFRERLGAPPLIEVFRSPLRAGAGRDRASEVTVARVGTWGPWTYADRDVANGESYQYRLRCEFRLPAEGLAGTDVVRLRIPVEVDVEGREQNIAAAPDPELRTLNLAIGQPELSLEGTTGPALECLSQLLDALAAVPGVRLTDHCFVRQAVSSLATAEALRAAQDARGIPAQFLLRLTDETTPRGEYLALWWTDLAHARHTRLGLVSCAGVPNQVAANLTAPLLKLVRDLAGDRPPVPPRTAPVKRLLIGPWFPVPDPPPVTGPADLATTMAAALGPRLPGVQVTALQPGLDQQGDLLTEAAVIGARVWPGPQGARALFVVAADLATGELLRWALLRDADAAPEGLAAWCRELRLTAARPAVRRRVGPLIQRQRCTPPLNPAWTLSPAPEPPKPTLITQVNRDPKTGLIAIREAAAGPITSRLDVGLPLPARLEPRPVAFFAKDDPIYPVQPVRSRWQQVPYFEEYVKAYAKFIVADAAWDCRQIPEFARGGPLAAPFIATAGGRPVSASVALQDLVVRANRGWPIPAKSLFVRRPYLASHVFRRVPRELATSILVYAAAYQALRQDGQFPAHPALRATFGDFLILELLGELGRPEAAAAAARLREAALAEVAAGKVTYSQYDQNVRIALYAQTVPGGRYANLGIAFPRLDGDALRLLLDRGYEREVLAPSKQRTRALVEDPWTMAWRSPAELRRIVTSYPDSFGAYGEQQLSLLDLTEPPP